MSNLFRMMADLAEDPAKLEAFRENPNVVMDEYQLTREQKQLLTSGNQLDLIRAIMDEHDRQFGPFRSDNCF